MLVEVGREAAEQQQKQALLMRRTFPFLSLSDDGGSFLKLTVESKSSDNFYSFQVYWFKLVYGWKIYG